MRGSLILGFFLLAFPAAAEVVFVSPQNGAQAIGPQAVEVTTDAQNVDRVEFYVDGVLIGVARNAPYRAIYDFGTSVEPRTITAKVLSDGYRKTETAQTLTASLTAGESLNVDLVEVPMRIRASRQIRPEDIRLRENSVEQSIRSIQPGRGPAHFAFVVDRSLSMGGGRLEAALRAVDRATKLLRRDDSASLVLFNHQVDRARVLPASNAASVVPSGGTSLRDAVASTLADSAKRTYVVVITDGGDRNSILADEEALRKISGTRSIVSAVVLGSPAKFLQRATSNTGGTLARATTGSVAREVQRIIEDINSRYTLVYQSRGNGGGWRTISIAPRRSGISIVSARKGYFAE